MEFAGVVVEELLYCLDNTRPPQIVAMTGNSS